MAIIAVVPYDSPKTGYGYICVSCAHKLLDKSPEEVDKAIGRSIFSPWEVSQDAQPKHICIICGNSTEVVQSSFRRSDDKSNAYSWVVQDVVEEQNAENAG